MPFGSVEIFNEIHHFLHAKRVVPCASGLNRKYCERVFIFYWLNRWNWEAFMCGTIIKERTIAPLESQCVVRIIFVQRFFSEQCSPMVIPTSLATPSFNPPTIPATWVPWPPQEASVENVVVPDVTREPGLPSRYLNSSCHALMPWEPGKKEKQNVMARIECFWKHWLNDQHLHQLTRQVHRSVYIAIKS